MVDANEGTAEAPDQDSDGASGEPVVPELPIPKQTPFYRAANRGRYQRQEMIAEIQAVTGRKLISYVAESAALTRDDVLPLMDVLHRIPTGSHIDFLLHTTGGDIDAADKIVRILRKRVGAEHELRVVVPDHAKSAGTLIAIGSDWIVMSESSELGPIDPQIITRDASGHTTQRPAHAYVDGYEALVATINDPASYEDGKRTDAEQLLLSKCDPAMLDLCRQALKRSRQLAEALLHQGMLREEASYTTVAGDLTDNQRWLSQHGAVIDSNDAQTLGLHVEYLAPDDEVWQAYWRLYCEQRLAITPDSPKLLESDYASLPVS
jgi:Serine dehydrogenase proteinase